MGSLGSVGEDLLRQLAPQALAAVIRRYGDFHAAEDAVQEALLAAAVQWPEKGIPDNPRAWLIHVSCRRMQDHIRSELARRHREVVAVRSEVSDEFVAAPVEAELHERDDDALILLFMCCHPALTRTSAIALTLRSVAGLTTAEIAQAYMVPEATMAQRISRAKQRVWASGVRFRMPTDDERRERLGVVMHVLYLIFNEGYATSSSGVALQRIDLSREAIRLTRLLHGLAPDEPEVAGLLALMLLTDARRDARTGPKGELVPLAEQDRSRWDRCMIAEGVELVTKALARGVVGPYQLQAAIAALHDEASDFEETDWAQILALYSLLKRMTDNPVVALNHAVTFAMVHGPEAGLTQLATIDADRRIAEHHRLAAVKAHLYERLGDHGRAAAYYRDAAERTRNIQERDYLIARAVRVRLHT